MGWAASERVTQRDMGRRRTWWAAERLRAAGKRPRRARRRTFKLFPQRQRRLQCPSVRVHAYGLGGGQRGRERVEADVERAVGANEDTLKGIKSLESLGVRERRGVRSSCRKQRAMRQTREGCAERLPDVGPCEPSAKAAKAAVPSSRTFPLQLPILRLRHRGPRLLKMRADTALRSQILYIPHSGGAYHASFICTCQSHRSHTRCGPQPNAWPLPHAFTLGVDTFSSRHSSEMLHTHMARSSPWSTDEWSSIAVSSSFNTATELDAIIQRQRAPRATGTGTAAPATPQPRFMLRVRKRAIKDHAHQEQTVHLQHPPI
jgi:hypothetical protein